MYREDHELSLQRSPSVKAEHFDHCGDDASIGATANPHRHTIDPTTRPPPTSGAAGGRDVPEQKLEKRLARLPLLPARCQDLVTKTSDLQVSVKQYETIPARVVRKNWQIGAQEAHQRAKWLPWRPNDLPLSASD